MRILLVFALATVLSGCGITAYNPSYIVSDGPQVTVDERSSNQATEGQAPSHP